MNRSTARSLSRRLKRRRAVERSLAKSRAFGLLARAMRYPDQELFTALRNGRWAAELAEAARAAGLRPPEAFFAALRRVTESLPGGLEGLQSQHNALYSSGSVCPQQESDYVAGHAFQKTDVMADVAGFYRAFGLRISRAQRELPDFIGSELEFLHALGWKEAQALQNGDPEAAEVCRLAHKEFLAEHLGVWISAFHAQMKASPAGKFYVLLARLAEELVAAQGVPPRFTPLATARTTVTPDPATAKACDESCLKEEVQPDTP
jgi:DMSO reductase family type II enzyme chaperone